MIEENKGNLMKYELEPWGGQIKESTFISLLLLSLFFGYTADAKLILCTRVSKHSYNNIGGTPTMANRVITKILLFSMKF